MKRFKKPKNGTVTLSNKDLLRIKKEVTDTATGTITLLYLLAMKDELGLDYDDLEKVFIRATRYSGYIDEKLTDLRTVAKILEKDTGIKINWR